MHVSNSRRVDRVPVCPLDGRGKKKKKSERHEGEIVDFVRVLPFVGFCSERAAEQIRRLQDFRIAQGIADYPRNSRSRVSRFLKFLSARFGAE